VRQLKLFIKTFSDKLALDRKHCILVIGVLTENCTLREHLHILGLSESAMCRNCGQEEEFSYHISRQCPALPQFTWLEQTDIRQTSFKNVSALTQRTGLTECTVCCVHGGNWKLLLSKSLQNIGNTTFHRNRYIYTAQYEAEVGEGREDKFQRYMKSAK
jgi:hypothetical protein